MEPVKGGLVKQMFPARARYNRQMSNEESFVCVRKETAGDENSRQMLSLRKMK